MSCKHCDRVHLSDLCVVCGESGHEPFNCSKKCPGIIEAVRILYKKTYYRCVNWSGDVNHLCAICARVWQYFNIDIPTRKGKFPPQRCWCQGNHLTVDHCKFNCRYCTPIRVSYSKHGDFEKFDTEYQCDHKFHNVTENEKWLTRFPEYQLSWK